MIFPEASFTERRSVPVAVVSFLIATDAVYIDEIVLAEMMPIANGGPSLAIVAGSTNWSADDNARYTFTNNGEGAFATAFDRLFDMYGKGLSLPANYLGTETIADSLIA